VAILVSNPKKTLGKILRHALQIAAATLICGVICICICVYGVYVQMYVLAKLDRNGGPKRVRCDIMFIDTCARVAHRGGE
jgi:hypothetical protein